jgi:hypothetical protein
MVTFMLVNGKMENKMEKELLLIQMVQLMLGNLKMDYIMDKEN